MTTPHSRTNPVVKETGDRFRDTLTLTVRGDGSDIPPFFTLHTYKTASYASGRRCKSGETPVSGMTNKRMIEYIDHLVDWVQEPSLLLMDRLSSHKSGEVIRYLEDYETFDGNQLFYPILLPPKTAFLISPLDMGAISAFKSHYYGMDRSSIHLKRIAVDCAWNQVSNESLKNICLNCGIVGEESISSLRSRFMKNVTCEVPKKLEEYLDYYDAWESGQIEVEGAKRGRGITTEIPHQLPEGHLGGMYWTNYGWRK